jgi:cell division protein FtsB
MVLVISQLYGSGVCACTFFRAVVLCQRVSKVQIRPKSKRRTPPPKAPGRHRSTVRLLLLFVAAVIVVDALVGDRGLLAMMRARKEYDELAATISHDREENARLRDEARRLVDDPATLEEVARRDLGLIRPGERVFIIKDIGARPKNDQSATSSLPQTQQPRR